MRLWQEIGKQLSEGQDAKDGLQNVTALRYMVTAKQGGYFQNIRAVYSFSGKEIVLLCGKERVIVRGKELTIRKYCEKDILIGGEIMEVCRGEDGA